MYVLPHRALLLLVFLAAENHNTEPNFKNYKQKIYHPEHNFTQLVYLKIDCPYNGSLKSLYLNFFSAVDRALGTTYEKQYTQKRHNEQKLLQLMGHIAHLHAIGLLVIDEIQHLLANRSKIRMRCSISLSH
jgi:hypothetical protein